ncbi:hypothetical protein CPAST_c04860 [Clostridium pasteurianum DSM 525 = ATCC 6013]|uniref:Lipoprotein n=1 Tax=Clostridium pasteurianum DSM 525 = ATCC 6013 TaxID=1262449 RepID=A0A0H3IYJ2_CLOPA|nr:hypothetical protein [Clostridium pasteurianum]AJA46586.1 hypothetical protein CPAST_c04860 [Clostridium pasteurianum DSM 525 = ATCC 6013]AJA50574.1 hypothetical protein CLPA_c04860 [Clostridium pasteurianum DSM 525 = ATCC 6013]AOZ74000.1 hypothetical protein AQ983_02320 [Clostridium pasteurianum DSM 525 = ATCC 6013]AOZ77797.1 hypothetical protein AQ984_02320 [Clostridium pasteurianum]ELP61152.1 hypothetical protein F502_01815 [Clostridium pasteurianum DSM 525 = ATCC 6013]
MIKKVNIILTLIIVFVTLIGCEGKLDNQQKSIYDDNSKIVTSSDSFNETDAKKSNSNGKIEENFGDFYGIRTLANITSSGDDGYVIINYSSNIINGKFKLVLVTPDNNVKEIQDTKSDKGEKIELKKGTTKIRIVGKDAKGEYRFKITEYSKVTILTQ